MKNLITFWDLRGHSFRAKGTAGNVWNVLKVTQGQCMVKRVCDGLEYWIDTQRLLDLVNAN